VNLADEQKLQLFTQSTTEGAALVAGVGVYDNHKQEWAVLGCLALVVCFPSQKIP
jgi:hypothetical protein